MAASADRMKALVKSHGSGDDEAFYSVALQVAAKAARQGKTRVSKNPRANHFTVVSLLIMLFGMWLGIVDIPLMEWLLLALALNTMFVTGWFIMKMAWASLRRGILNQHVLLEFAAFAGIAGGFLGLFVLDDFPVGGFFAAATLVTTYHILSHYSSLVVRTRSSQAVRRLMDLRPDTATVIRDGREIEIPIDDVVKGDRVRIRPGESIPVDGTVLDGVSAVDEALVTGESIPAEKIPGDDVIGGSINQTGTITRGEPALQTIIPTDGHTDDEVLQIAASVEMNSEHPLARAIEDAAEARDLSLADTDTFESHTGHGVEATLNGARILVGKPTWLAGHGVDLGPLDTDRLALEEAGQTVIAIARGNDFLGLISIADAIKDDAAETIQRIKDAGITPVMLSGDNRRTAHNVAAQVGIDDVSAEVLPDEKAAVIRRLQQGEIRVMMVGDGINDAPALTQADIGVAIGAGTDIAIDSADIVIMGGRLGSVMDAHEIGVSSYRKTKQNLALAFSFNGIGVLAAVTGLVSPVWAMIAMISSVTAVLANSFRGRLLRGESRNTRYASTTQDDHHQGADPAAAVKDDRAFTSAGTDLLALSIDGHPVRFWATRSIGITVATLLAGVWWT